MGKGGDRCNVHGSTTVASVKIGRFLTGGGHFFLWVAQQYIHVDIDPLLPAVNRMAQATKKH
jgi:hypothetical protein